MHRAQQSRGNRSSNRPRRQSLGRRIETKRYTLEFTQTRDKLFDRRARIEMRLARKEKRAVETAAEMRLAYSKFIGVEPFMPGSPPRETDEIGTVARGGDKQAAVDRRQLERLAPESQTFETPFNNERRRTLGFAPGRQHAAGKIGAAAAGRGLALDDFNRLTSRGEFIGCGEAGDTGA